MYNFIIKTKTMDLQLNETLDQLTDYILSDNFIGTSATASMAEVEIKGELYQLQLRLEKSPKDFIHPSKVVSGAITKEIKY